MTKADIVERVAARVGCKKKEAVEYVETVFAIMKNTLEVGEQVKISGFGKFEIQNKKARKGRNPQTGEKMTITARRILTFKSSHILRAKINQDQN